MSDINRDVWLEAANENFEQAVLEGNYALCKDIIADVQEVDLTAGHALNRVLRDTPVSKFAIKSDLI